MVCAALALVILVLTCVSDNMMCDFGPRLGLLSAALALHLVAGVVMYSLSSCGCSLCLCCSGSCCGLAIQATTAMGFSLVFWLLGMGGYILALLFHGLFQMDAVYFHANPGYTCLVSFYWLLPQGVGPWCGICSAAAFLLQGHFITLVEEAVASLRAAAGPAADPQLSPQTAPALVIVDPAALQAPGLQACVGARLRRAGGGGSGGRGRRLRGPGQGRGALRRRPQPAAARVAAAAGGAGACVRDA